MRCKQLPDTVFFVPEDCKYILFLIALGADFECVSVPRNCRFLQGAHTDRQPVQRLKTAINEEKESVELLLNYKKNGDPFWNLLYVGK